MEAIGSHQKKNSIWFLTGIPLLYLVIALFITWPTFNHLTTEYAGGRGDLMVHQWTFWWAKQALLTGQNPFYTTMLYYPEGVPLLSHNIAWLNIAYWLPLQAFIGEVAAYNVMFISIFTLNGFAAFLFAREIMCKTAPAFIAGLVVCTWPYTISHFDHPNMILVFPLPLAMLFLTRTIKRLRWRDAILTAFFIAMLGIGRWQLLIMATPLLIGYLLYLLAVTPSARTKTGIERLAVTAVLAGLIMLPPAIPLIQSQLQEDAAQVAIEEPDNGRTDLLSYIVAPQLYNRIWGEKILEQNLVYAEPYQHITASIHYIPFIGYGVLLLLLLGVFKRWPQTRLWLLLALIYIILALGPELSINKHLYLAGWTPYGLLLEGNFLGDFIRRPHRLNIILSIPMGLMAGWGTAVLLAWAPVKKRKWVQLGTIGLITFAILAESKFTVPFMTTKLEIPVWHAQLAQESETFGLFEIPINDRSFDKFYMSYQTQHGKPIASGHVSRMPQEAWAALDQYPWVAYVSEQDNFPDFTYTAVGKYLRQLHENNIRYLIVHKQFLGDGVPEIWRDWFTIDPLYEDDQLMVYATEMIENETYHIKDSLTEEIGLLWSNYAPQDVSQGGLIKVDARWASTAVPAVDYLVCLDIQAETANEFDFPSDQAACQPITPDYATIGWQVNEIIRGSHQLSINPDSSPGTYDLIMGLVDRASQLSQGQVVELGSITIHPYPPENQADVQWQNNIQLTGYNIDQTEEELIFTPHWQLTEPVTNSYKLFIHIINPENMEIVAQSDTIPRSWTYPTNIWESGEIVREEIRIPIGELPDGRYEIWLGWYDILTGERVFSQSGDERLFIDEFEK